MSRSLMQMAMGQLEAFVGFSARRFQTAAAAASGQAMAGSKSGQEEDLPKPSYTYASPGSSIMDPPYSTGNSLDSPNYIEYDPKPRASLADPLPNMSLKAEGCKQGPSHASTSAALNAAQKAAADLHSSSAGSSSGTGPTPQPTYVYMPPGASMADPTYGISTKDPVYMIDPVPETTTSADATASSQAGSSSKAAKKQQAVAQQPAPGKVRMGLKDDYANNSYNTTAKGEVEDVHFISMTDPLDRQFQPK